MKKFKSLILILVLVFLSSSLARLIIKLLFESEVLLIDIFNYLACLSLPIIMLFLEKESSKKRLVITSIFFPIILTLITYLTGLFN